MSRDGSEIPPAVPSIGKTEKRDPKAAERVERKPAPGPRSAEGYSYDFRQRNNLKRGK